MIGDGYTKKDATRRLFWYSCREGTNLPAAVAGSEKGEQIGKPICLPVLCGNPYYQPSTIDSKISALVPEEFSIATMIGPYSPSVKTAA